MAQIGPNRKTKESLTHLLQNFFEALCLSSPRSGLNDLGLLSLVLSFLGLFTKTYKD